MLTVTEGEALDMKRTYPRRMYTPHRKTAGYVRSTIGTGFSAVVDA